MCRILRLLASIPASGRSAAWLAFVLFLIGFQLVGVQAIAGDFDAAKIEKGMAIYSAQCASCHGERGEGVSGAYPNALTGDFTISEIAKVVDETMPEGEPEKCRGEDAQAVAAYMHSAFYSLEAQAKLNPPRIAFARLTANQLRSSLSDLYGRFSGFSELKPERGVRAQYFDGDRFKKENEKIARVDPVIDFDFGKESPGEGIAAESFYIYWEGSLLPEKTGRYEIVVNSSCSFKMSFGKLDRIFIDNHVQSGDKTEFRQSIHLTAGRLYPFKIDFIQRKRKTELPPARIRLSWVPPGGVEQTIPDHHLVPSAGPATFSLQASLPADDRSYGFERGLAVNKQWDESTTASAVEFAQIAASELFPRYVRSQKDKPNDQRQILKGFLEQVLAVAFRGALDADLVKLYVNEQVDQTEDDAEAIRRVLLLGLKSPRFLYPLADVDKTVSRRTANRLALTLFDSLPADEWLLRKIDKNELETESQVREAAKRMLSDYRARAKLLDGFHEWLNLSQQNEITKNQELYPGFDAELAMELRQSLRATIEEIVWSDASDYRQLFRSKSAFTTAKIASFYGEEWAPLDSSRKGLQKTANESERRFGVLTHPLLMSQLAYHDTTSPIHRGVFLIRFLLGRTLRPPNEAFSPLSPDLHPNLTTRERVALQTSPQNCQACHVKINALGFALENYDAVGRYRATEGEKPIDATGSYRSRDDLPITFQGAPELASYLADAPDAHRAFVNKLFQHMVKQPPDAYGLDTLKKLTDQFRQNGYNIRDLVVEIAVTASRIHATPLPANPTSVALKGQP
ncbi:DUF1588 domain-containing protein [Pirellulaceae bacterium SH467]